MSSGLEHLVTDWGGFEKFVADLHSTGDFEIERNVVLPARAGGTYEIDVLLRSRSGPYTFTTLVSCKYWSSNVPRTAINDLKEAREQVGAQKAICFTTKGYQDPSATSAALEAGIDLFVVKDLLSEDWGSPPVITFVLQLLESGAQVVPRDPIDENGGALPANWLADVEPRAVQVLKVDGAADGTLGDRADKLLGAMCKEIQDRRAIYSGGIEMSFSEAIMYPNVNFEGGPRLLRYGGRSARVEWMRCGAVVRIHQRPIVVDRSRGFDFAVVVEDYLRAERTIVSRRPGGTANWSRPDPATPSDDVLTSDTLIVCARLSAPLPHDEVMRVLAAPGTAAPSPS
ncbi:MAG: restriction endonuclease [Kofleriaceae bacterium]